MIWKIKTIPVFIHVTYVRLVLLEKKKKKKNIQHETLYTKWIQCVGRPIHTDTPIWGNERNMEKSHQWSSMECARWRQVLCNTYARLAWLRCLYRCGLGAVSVLGEMNTAWMMRVRTTHTRAYRHTRIRRKKVDSVAPLKDSLLWESSRAKMTFDLAPNFVFDCFLFSNSKRFRS